MEIHLAHLGVPAAVLASTTGWYMFCGSLTYVRPRVRAYVRCGLPCRAGIELPTRTRNVRKYRSVRAQRVDFILSCVCGGACDAS